MRDGLRFDDSLHTKVVANIRAHLNEMIEFDRLFVCVCVFCA